MNKCPYCGNYHEGNCPRVASISYHPDGTISQVRFHASPVPDAGESPVATSRKQETLIPLCESCELPKLRCLCPKLAPRALEETRAGEQIGFLTALEGTIDFYERKANANDGVDQMICGEI